ncbi:hypothetical protein V7128_19145 [Neobacillus vireti]|uniref:hypothetical protein n=1 Tax=Neobacillus vireti TaxID=220686 RepID=UPI002FFD60FB
MAKKFLCRVCKKEESEYLDCDRCWKFRVRAYEKYPVDSRGVRVEGFNSVEEFALYLREEYDKYNKCAYTRIEMMVEERGKKKRLEKQGKLDEKRKYSNQLKIMGFSVDRKNPDKPYERDNILLCLNIINLMKTTFKHDEFLQACHEVLKTEVEKQRTYADQVLGMVKSLYETHGQKPIIPIVEGARKVAGCPEQEEEDRANKKY